MLRVYNTLTRKKEIFKPIKDDEVSIYACGPTVYSTPHIGNYRTFFTTDIIVRSLEYLGYRVKLVMNITDIDDKTIRNSKKAGMSLKDFTEKYTQEFFHGLNMLNIRSASAYPRATENVDGMIELTKKLIEKEMAYEKGGSVYFRISSFKDYGKLSKIDMEKMKIGASVDVDEYDKENPRDFVLLKASNPEEIERGIYYESPWGKIRPGWHTECSVMAMKEFGPTLDIHAGGVDLIFPHHENEIAQSQGATGRTFVHYWVHIEHLLVSGEKMSKSKGNVFKLSQIIEKYSGEIIRYMFLSVHYRRQLNYTQEFAENARNSYLKLKETLDNLEFILKSSDQKEYPGDRETLEALPELENRFKEALEDDFNTPKALMIFREFSHTTNRYIETGKNRTVLEKTLSLYRQFADVFGIFSKIKKEKVPEEIVRLVEERDLARKNKDWQKADDLRNKVKELGYIIEDLKEGSKIKKIGL